MEREKNTEKKKNNEKKEEKDGGKDVSERILILYEECLSLSDYYINLDTLRKNKISTMEKTIKKNTNTYIDHSLKIFSTNLNTFNHAKKILNDSYNLTEEKKEIKNEIKHETKLEIKNNYNIFSHFFEIVNIIKNSISYERGIENKKIENKKIENKKIENKIEKDTKPIPKETRSKVWRKWCGNTLDGVCYCCDSIIQYEKWHCGHIQARYKGGTVDEENLRPVCIKCNLDMKTLHMYEYMIFNRLPGCRKLPQDDEIVKIYIDIVKAIIKTQDKLDDLEKDKKITKTKANEYRKKIISKKSPTEMRIQTMKEVEAIYNK